IGIDESGAFLYSAGQLMRLDLRDATSINAAGEVVGGMTLDGGLEAAALYADGQIKDLNGLIDPLSGWHLQLATGINDRGQIVGFGTNPFGSNHGFILTPIPDPNSLVVLGLAPYIFIRARRKY